MNGKGTKPKTTLMENWEAIEAVNRRNDEGLNHGTMGWREGEWIRIMGIFERVNRMYSKDRNTVFP